MEDHPMRKRKLKKRIQKMPVKALTPHPERRLGVPSEREVRLLATNMAKNGQRTSLHVLSDGSVLDGLKRLRAAQSLLWTELRCEVQIALDSDPDAVEQYMLDHALRSKQLSRAERAEFGGRLRELTDAQKRRRQENLAALLTEIADRTGDVRGATDIDES
jgi:ParB-like chromosome segregation protein Spo0J